MTESSNLNRAYFTWLTRNSTYAVNSRGSYDLLGNSGVHYGGGFDAQKPKRKVTVQSRGRERAVSSNTVATVSNIRHHGDSVRV
jgi:hypothetical protein